MEIATVSGRKRNSGIGVQPGMRGGGGVESMKRAQEKEGNGVSICTLCD